MTSKKINRTKKPNCGHCRRRDVCVKVCDRLEEYFNSLIPHKGREYPIGIPHFVNNGLSKLNPYDVSKIKTLSDDEKRALVLRVVNTPVKEIAKMLGIQPRYVKGMIYTARRKLRLHIEKTDKGEEKSADAGTETLTRRDQSGRLQEEPAES